MSFIDTAKQKIWNFIYRFFPTVQKALLRSHIIFHEGRQKYHIGWLAPGKTLEDLKRHLHAEWNFGNHFVAWEDEGQVLSWRKLVNFHEQYHLRVFENGEIRGHFERTPEAHPIKHFLEKGEEEKHADFANFLGDYMVRETHISHLAVDPNAYNPASQITIENHKAYKPIFNF